MQGCKLVYKFVVDSLLLHCKGPFCKLSCTQRLVQSLHTILAGRKMSFMLWSRVLMKLKCIWLCIHSIFRYPQARFANARLYIATPFDRYSLLETKKFTYESCSSYKFKSCQKYIPSPSLNIDYLLLSYWYHTIPLVISLDMLHTHRLVCRNSAS